MKDVRLDASRGFERSDGTLVSPPETRKSKVKEGIHAFGISWVSRCVFAEVQYSRPCAFMRSCSRIFRISISGRRLCSSRFCTRRFGWFKRMRFRSSKKSHVVELSIDSRLEGYRISCPGPNKREAFQTRAPEAEAFWTVIFVR
jgi:hypothetical protein